jgi:methionyl aminopeptidase
MQEKADQLGLGIVTGFVGHGIGRHLHELPKAPAWWSPGGPPDFTLKPGLVLAIEPIVTSSPGLTPTELAPDGWTVRTRDNSLAAHVEAVVGIDPAGDRVRILAGRGALGG